MVSVLDSGSSGPGSVQALFSKVPKTFRAQKAICEIANHLFWKADLLTCFQGNKKKITVKFDGVNFVFWSHLGCSGEYAFYVLYHGHVI